MSELDLMPEHGWAPECSPASVAMKLNAGIDFAKNLAMESVQFPLSLAKQAEDE